MSGTVDQFADYDVIRGLSTDPKAPAEPVVTDGSTLDLSAEFGERPVILEGSSLGKTFITSGGNNCLI
ncbi:hypothetical protein [Aureimonas phyllosphaerae]|uniref:Uncharacterized protein n=1 Tax=Aureimonas phyllosphaerae TaxID=1166078 RepID=A0A7W6C1Y5_9HYPH|nr:hypothetical protein [Aureimonas phyllosphaerae]MBB3938006.1 hypothetical protein [Aureimonas phyllosphaerae]MBB3962013.1 hypothetical protein [Aureimonas phyllosphaerae]SFF53898.1 hypothetical protein SAMN05216566_12414 [Aureimonas phyllosphaerae]